MREDTILAAIDEAVGESTRCTCGKELHVEARDDAIWLACPTFAASSRLPVGLVTFIRELTHDRRVVAALADQGPAILPASARTVAATRPSAVNL